MIPNDPHRLYAPGKVDADADLFIDGEVLGNSAWREARLLLEHPSEDNGKFTFYLLDSAEGREIELKASQSLGLIQVCFKPEHRLVREAGRLAAELRTNETVGERLKEATSLLRQLQDSNGQFPPDREVVKPIENGLTKRFGPVTPPPPPSPKSTLPPQAQYAASRPEPGIPPKQSILRASEAPVSGTALDAREAPVSKAPPSTH